MYSTKEKVDGNKKWKGNKCSERERAERRFEKMSLNSEVHLDRSETRHCMIKKRIVVAVSENSTLTVLQTPCLREQSDQLV